jgi:hypothetical protein
VTPEVEVGRYGLRSFRYLHDNTTLRPIASGLENIDCWVDGTCEAQCLRHIFWWSEPYSAKREPSGHEAPDEDCNCGIYGSLSYQHLYNAYPHHAGLLVAVIAAEGQTLLGPLGFRTQFARVVAYAPRGIGVRVVALRQFKDAKEYVNITQMLADYHIPYYGAEGKGGGWSGSTFWKQGEERVEWPSSK